MLAEDTTREEELLLIPADDRGARITAESLIQAVQTRQKFGCAASLDLFGRLPATLRCAFRGERTSALLLLARSSAALERADEIPDPEQMTKTDKANPNALDIETRTRSLENFIRFFGEIKAQLDEDKYRFAFAYACGRIIGTFAGLAAENQTQELRAFDKFLKEENMALRVAAKERSAIVRRLIRYDYCAPFWLRPLCAAVAAKDRAKE